jgi:hypothetical protein
MTEEVKTVMNEHLVLISGESGTGKSASLLNIPNKSKWMYLNCEAGKRLPFKNDFQTFKIVDPYQVYEAFDHATANPDDYDGIALDTSTFLMNMYESMYVLNSANTQSAWGGYFQYFTNLMQDKVVKFNKPTLILAHTRTDLDETAMEMKTKVPVKGALQNNGIEAFFSTVVSTKKIQLTELEKYKNNMLHITEDDELLGFKHVFQTRLTKKTVGERIRSPMSMFTREETYIDNDAHQLLEYMNKFYS